MTQDIAQKLINMKNKVTTAETETTRLEGRLQGELESLKQFGVATLEEAKTELDDVSTTIDADEKLLKDGVAKLEGEYTWEA